MVGVLIHFLYATSSRTQSLKPVRISSKKILGGDSYSVFPLLKDKNPLYVLFSRIHIRVDDHCDAAHVRHFCLFFFLSTRANIIFLVNNY